MFRVDTCNVTDVIQEKPRGGRTRPPGGCGLVSDMLPGPMLGPEISVGLGAVPIQSCAVAVPGPDFFFRKFAISSL